LRNYKRKVLPPQTKGANHDGMRINNENNKQRLSEYHKANQILKAWKKRIMFTQYRKKRGENTRDRKNKWTGRFIFG
jgi:hypothetical protein